MNFVHLSPLSVVFLLAGCASALNTADHDSFACPGMPDGVICKSPAQVYRATHTRGSVTEEPLKSKERLMDTLAGKATDTSTSSPTLMHLSLTQTGSPNLPLPILEPAKVMRIWIAPWEDSKKDLHWPSYLFTEIQPRKWSFGKSEFTGSRPVVPHLMTMPGAQPSAPDRVDSGQAGAVQPVFAPQAVSGIPEAALPQPDDALLGAR